MGCSGVSLVVAVVLWRVDAAGGLVALLGADREATVGSGIKGVVGVWAGPPALKGLRGAVLTWACGTELRLRGCMDVLHMAAEERRSVRQEPGLCGLHAVQCVAGQSLHGPRASLHDGPRAHTWCSGSKVQGRPVCMLGSLAHHSAKGMTEQGGSLRRAHQAGGRGR